MNTGYCNCGRKIAGIFRHDLTLGTYEQCTCGQWYQLMYVECYELVTD